MKKALSLVIAIILAVSLFGMNVSAVGESETDIVLYASPDGSDTASGTFESPLSLSGAKEALKGLKNENSTATVYLLGGTYFLNEPLNFTADDMGNVTYKAYKNQEVSFSGATPVSGFTETEVNGVKVFKAQLDTSKDDWYFKSLFSDTNELQVTRYPEEGYFTVKATADEDDIWNAENAPWEFTRGQRSFYADTKEISVDFHNPEDVNVRILHYWHDELMHITAYDSESGKISLSRPSSMLIKDIDRYYFENVFEALNTSGEWYLDSVSGELYYVPFEGEKADELTLYGSNTDRLADINGVDGISFEGVRFERTDWEYPQADGVYLNSWYTENDIDFPQAAMFVDGVITVNYAENIHLINCEFTDLGGTAVKFKNGVKNSSVENCYFENIAATAIFVGGENCLPEQPDYTENITIKNNEIYKYGRKFYCAIGIQITFCDTAEIVNNEIHDGYYTGISCGWIWGYAYHATKNINISRNLIYNIGQGWLSDMGGIYMLGKQPGTVLSENVIHNVAADPGEGGYGGWGIYLDEGSSFMTVEKNLVYSCGSQGLNIHYGEGNIIRNNISALSAEGQVNPGPKDEEHATAFYYNNIFLTSDKAPVYVNMKNNAHFSDNGNLMWSVTEGEELYFDTGDSVYTLKLAQALGFIKNPVVADPCFADALNFDFTLDESSPAFPTNFEAWDYSVAGTLKDSVIGLSRQGGQTAYNAEAYSQNIGEFNHDTFYNWIPLIYMLCPLLVFLGWLVICIIKGKKTTAIPTLAMALATVCFPLVYYTYIEWIEALYFLFVFILAALASVITACLASQKGKSKKSIILTFIISFVLSGGIFLGLAGIMNLLLNPDSPEVISIASAVMLIWMIVQLVLIQRNMKKKSVDEN